MVTIRDKNFSLAKICDSGQCFRMENCGGGRYRLVALGRYLEAEQDGDCITFDCAQDEFDLVWREYFDLATDYAEILASVDKEDAYLSAAAEYGRGIRILNQDLWEMIISFIVSQQTVSGGYREAVSNILISRHRDPWRRLRWKTCMPAVWDIGADISAGRRTAYAAGIRIWENSG